MDKSLLHPYLHLSCLPRFQKWNKFFFLFCILYIVKISFYHFWGSSTVHITNYVKKNQFELKTLATLLFLYSCETPSYACGWDFLWRWDTWAAATISSPWGNKPKEEKPMKWWGKGICLRRESLMTLLSCQANPGNASLTLQ